jgi:serine/threonine protein kinase
VEDPEGIGPFLVLEYLEGHDLNDVWNNARQRRTPLPLGFTLRVGRDVCQALEVCHAFKDSRGRPSPIIHRDVALKNVMVTFDGRVKLLDFGLAKVEGRPGQTNVGMVKGTTGYMSPEQVIGAPLDIRTDLFSTGVLLHELLTGERLFEGETESAEMRQSLAVQIPSPQGLRGTVPIPVGQVVMKALAKERADRFSSAREMAVALERSAPHVLYEQPEMAHTMEALYEESRRRTVLVPTIKDVPERRRDTQAGTRLFRPRLHRWAPVLVGALVFFVGVGFLALLVEQERRSSTALRRQSTTVPQALPRTERSSPQTSPQREEVATRKGISARTGSVTLVSFPVAKVTRGGKFLGVTPLFKVSLPVGTHVLRLEGPDGRARRLSVPVRAGAESILKVSLDDLPIE